MQPSGPIPVPTRKPRSAGTAFLISLFVPGSGQLYSGKKIRGIPTFVFSLIAAAGVLAFHSETSWWGASLRSLVSLYIFSFIDAYYAAIEINSGKDPGPYQNPRVAAVLNLLTNGFGYFYLGERAKGLIVFLGMRLLGFVLSNVPWVWELINLGIAIDAYRIGRRELIRGKGTHILASQGVLQLGLREEYVPETPTTEPTAPAAEGFKSRLSPLIPLSLGGILACAYAGLVLMGTLMPDYRVLDQSSASFQQTREERIYSNPRYGVEFHVPANWVFDFGDTGALVHASSADGVCRVRLLIDAISPIFGLESGTDAVVARVLSQGPNIRMVGQREVKLGIHPAYEITFSQNLVYEEYLTRYVLARKGMTLYSLVTMNNARFDDDCRRLTDVIRLRLVLPMD